MSICNLWGYTQQKIPLTVSLRDIDVFVSWNENSGADTLPLYAKDMRILQLYTPPPLAGNKSSSMASLEGVSNPEFPPTSEIIRTPVEVVPVS